MMARNSKKTNTTVAASQFNDLQQKLWAVASTNNISNFERAPGNEFMLLSKRLLVDLGVVGINYHNLNTYVKGRRPGASDKPKNDALIKFIKTAISDIGSISDTDVFQMSFVELFKNSDLLTQYKVRQKENTKVGAAMDDMFLIHLDYDKINIGDIEDAIRVAGKLNQSLMYHSPAAVKIWEGIANDKGYGLYRICESNLKTLLQLTCWTSKISSLGSIVILGAGAASKDTLIIQSLESLAKNEIEIVWVDVSLYMLANTVKKVMPNITLPNIKPRAIATDFEYPERLDSIMEELKIDHTGIRATFILGSTLSNIDENDFFREFCKTCSDDDLLIISMEHVRDDVDFNDLLMKRYGSEVSKSLARAAFTINPEILIGSFDSTEVSVKNYFFNNQFNSYEVLFRTKVTLKSAGIKDKWVTTARATRHPRDVFRKYIESFGFELILPIEDQGVVTWLFQFSCQTDAALKGS